MDRNESIINNFSNLKCLVIGEAMLDVYFRGFTTRLCKEAPVPVVDIESIDCFCGGAANTAVNVAALGAETTFLSAAGSDKDGKALMQILKNKKINTKGFVLDKNRRTLTKKRIVSNDTVLLRFDSGTALPPDSKTEEQIILNLNYFYPLTDAVIISDYGYGILTKKIIKALGNLQKKYQKILVVDSKQLNAYKNIGVTLVKPNFSEAMDLLDINRSQNNNQKANQINTYKNQLFKVTGARIVAVTMDLEGALIMEKNGNTFKTSSKKAENLKAVGAGDSFCAAVALSLAAGADIKEASEIAAAASSITARKEGTAFLRQTELKHFFATNSKYIENTSELKKILAELKKAGKKIVFTNGCFDILHSGHINFLNQAKQLGDILVVGVNTDLSVRRLKGFKRPVNKLTDRVRVLAGLSSVDFIIQFKEDDPVNLIKLLKPEVYTKGGDYKRETLPETQVVEEYNGEVVILPYTLNYSTSNIISKIQIKGKNNEHYEKLGRLY